MATYFITADQAAAILHLTRDAVVRLVKSGRLRDHGETKAGLTRHTYKFIVEEVQELNAVLLREAKELAEKKNADLTAKVAQQGTLPICDHAVAFAELIAKVDRVLAILQKRDGAAAEGV